jgi:hypothetical protein
LTHPAPLSNSVRAFVAIAAQATGKTMKFDQQPSSSPRLKVSGPLLAAIAVVIAGLTYAGLTLMSPSREPATKQPALAKADPAAAGVPASAPPAKGVAEIATPPDNQTPPKPAAEAPPSADAPAEGGVVIEGADQFAAFADPSEPSPSTESAGAVPEPAAEPEPAPAPEAAPVSAPEYAASPEPAPVATANAVAVMDSPDDVDPPPSPEPVDGVPAPSRTAWFSSVRASAPAAASAAVSQPSPAATSEHASEPEPTVAEAAPTAHVAAAPGADALSPWWPQRSVPGRLNLLYAGQAAQERTVGVLFDSKFTEGADVGPGLQLLKSDGSPASGEWEVNSTGRMLLFRNLKPGRYTVVVSPDLANAAGLTVGTELRGPVYIR